MNIDNYVLYAEDDLDDIEMLKNSLGELDPEKNIIPVRNGEELMHFLEALRSDQMLPCLIILDVNMPRVNGEQALRQLKESKRYNRIPVVLFSTSSYFPNQELLKQYQVDFVQKPSTVEKWRNVVKDLVMHCDIARDKNSSS